MVSAALKPSHNQLNINYIWYFLVGLYFTLSVLEEDIFLSNFCSNLCSLRMTAIPRYRNMRFSLQPSIWQWLMELSFWNTETQLTKKNKTYIILLSKDSFREGNWRRWRGKKTVTLYLPFYSYTVIISPIKPRTMTFVIPIDLPWLPLKVLSQ